MLLCVATHKYPFLQEWEFSAQKYGWKYRILGMGHKWRGYQTKMRLILSALRGLREDEPVLITDAYDLLLTGSPKKLQVGDKIIVGAEKRKGPNALPVPHSKSFYPNMGFVCGKAGILHQMYSHIFDLCPHDDQIGVCMYMQENPSLFHLDTKGEFVLNINYSSQIPNKIQTLAVHIPFMHLDLGYRVNRILEKVGRPLIPLSESLRFLLKHLWREAFNPAFRELSICFLLNLFLLPYAGLRWREGYTPWGLAGIIPLLYFSEVKDRSVLTLILLPSLLLFLSGSLAQSIL